MTSEYAARAALASGRQNKYWPFHLAMLGHQGKVTKAVVDQIAEAQGLDMKKLHADMEDPKIAAVITENQKLAQALAINGTPAFIIDRKVIPGYLPKDDLAATIKDVRASGGCTAC
ncbi:DsbA family protein [Aestuariivirga sp.]|uniref:DsbA family protein n=1 Tax=Aestuariivirga sp. TaxID=2650926 RepID=UPI0039E433DD